MVGACVLSQCVQTRPRGLANCFFLRTDKFNINKIGFEPFTPNFNNFFNLFYYSHPMATWYDLPFEIVDQILKPLDDTDLINNVIYVNSTLRSHVSREYLRRRNIAESKSIVLGDTDIRSTLRALQKADWIKNVPILTVRLRLTPSVFATINDVASFIHGLDSLGTLNFEIDKDGETNQQERYMLLRNFGNPFYDDGKQKLRDQWWGCFIALLNAAFSKGLKGLHISEPTPGMLYEYSGMYNITMVPSLSGLRHIGAMCGFGLLSCFQPAGWYSKKFSKYSIKCLCNLCTAEASGKARIQDVRLSSVMLSRLFWYPDTTVFTILRVHASTIHTLHLDEYKGLFDKTGRSWSSVLRGLRFPLLERFTLTGGPPCGYDHYGSESTGITDINNLLVFLNCHPRIVHLELTKSLKTRNITFTQGAPSLPNLRTLIARNDVAAHILQQPGNCGRLGLLHLRSGRLVNHDIERGLFSPGPGCALAAISSNVSHAIKIEFSLTTAPHCLLWMNEDANIPPQLKQVSEIRILLENDDISRNEDLVLNVLPKWLESFPALERLRVDLENDGYRADLRAAILRSRARLRLKSLMINNTVAFKKG